jgi:hypothetical protein
MVLLCLVYGGLVNRGFIKTYRKTLEGDWLKNWGLWAFWSWCLLKATHKERDVLVGNQQVHLMPGEFIFGRKKAAAALGATERNVRTWLHSLEIMQNVTIRSTNKYSVISIINWVAYQGDDSSERPTERPVPDQQPTSNRPTDGHKQECKKNVKKEKNVKNKYLECVFLSSDEEIALKEKLVNGDYETAIEILNNYKMQSGKKYTSDYHAILNWVVKEVEKRKGGLDYGSGRGNSQAGTRQTPQASGGARSDGQPYPCDLES